MSQVELTTLGESCEFFNGKAHEKDIDVDGKYIVVNSKFISQDGKVLKRTKDQMFPLFKGDIVMVMSDVPNGKALAKCAIIDEDDTYSLNQRICCIRSKEFDTKYLYYQLNRNEHFLAFNNGENQTNLRKGDILACPLLKPSLEEQKRIVAELERTLFSLDQAKANAEKNLQNAKELFESYLHGVFENQGEGWEDKSLGDVCDFVRGPFGGSLKKSIFKESGYAVYEQQHAIYNQFSEIRYFIDENKFNEMKRFELKPNDLIMSCSGTMGKVAIVPDNITKGIINQALLKLTCKSELNVDYLKLWMDSSHFINELDKHTVGAAIKNVASVKVLKTIQIPLPPLPQQQKIVRHSDTLKAETHKLENLYQKKIEDIDELKQWTLQKAFQRELETEKELAL